MIESFLERSHRKVRKEPASKSSDTYYQTEWKTISDEIGIQVCFVSIREGDQTRLPEGIYLGGNLTADLFITYASLLLPILVNEVNKMFLKESIMEIDGDQLVDTASIMRLYLTEYESDNMAVFLLQPILPSEFDKLVPRSI